MDDVADDTKLRDAAYRLRDALCDFTPSPGTVMIEGDHLVVCFAVSRRERRGEMPREWRGYRLECRYGVANGD